MPGDEEGNQAGANRVQVTVNNNPRPVFFGREKDDADLHWLLFEDWLEDNNVPENQAVTKFRSTLNGDARLWYKQNKATFTDLATLEQKFKQNFCPPISRPNMILELSQFRLEQNETVLSYMNRIRKHVLKGNIDDQEMVTTYFVEGLPDSIKDIVRGHGKKTLEEAFAVANSLSVGRSAPKPATTTASTSQAQESLCAPMQSLHMTRSESRDRRNSYSQPRDGYSPHRNRRRSTSRQRQEYRRPHDRYDRPYSPHHRGRRMSRDRNNGPRSYSQSSWESHSRSGSRGRFRPPTPGRRTPDRQKHVDFDDAPKCDNCRKLKKKHYKSGAYKASQQDFQ